MIWSIYHIVTSSLDPDNMKHDSWTVTQTLADNNAYFLLLLLAANLRVAHDNYFYGVFINFFFYNLN